MQHATLHLGYIWAALAVALGAGLPIGVYLTFVLGFGVPVGAGFASLMQTHGHLQLVGWAGLFVMGISVHFLPRLAGVPLAAPQWLRRILGCMIAGLGVRALGQALVPYLTDQQLLPVVLWMLVASGVLEWSGILGYVLLLLRLVRGVHDTSQRPALLSVRPFFGMMVSGWVVYGSLNLLLLVHMALQRVVVVSPAWNRLAMQSFVELVLLPVAFAFSLRLLPLYLRRSCTSTLRINRATQKPATMPPLNHHLWGHRHGTNPLFLRTRARCSGVGIPHALLLVAA
jgi:uncharacterized protein involved in response to NO